MNLFSRIFHWSLHKLGLNTGRVVSWNDYGKESNTRHCYVGFMCSGCGEIDKKTVSMVKFEKENENE